MVLSIIGQDLDSVIKRDLKDFDIKDQTVDRGFGERIGDFIFGRDSETINKAAAAEYLDQQQNSQAGRALQALSGNSLLQGYGGTGITSYDDATALSTRLGQAQELLAARQLANVEGVDRDKILGTEDVSALARLTKNQAGENEWQSKPNQELRRQTGLQEAFNRRQETRQNRIDDENLAERKLERLDRAEGRRDSLDMKLMEIGLMEQAENNKMDRYYQEVENQRYDSTHKRNANLIGALALLGSAFAI